MNRGMWMPVVLVLVLSASLAMMPGASGVNPNPVQSIRITPQQDGYVQLSQPATTHNTPPSLYVYASTTETIRALIQFYIQNIPSGSTIVDAHMYVWVQNSTVTNTQINPIVELHLISQSWTEISVTWNNQPTVLADKVIQGVSNATIGMPAPFPIDVFALVNYWYTGGTNYGLELRWQSDTSGSARNLTFASADVGNIQPYLIVDYQSSAIPSNALVTPYYYCSGGPCELSVFSGSGLAPWLWTAYMSENGNSTLSLPTGNSAVPSTNLKLSYNMDTLTVDNRMYNFAPGAIGGVITGTTSVAGKYGQARSFDGSAWIQGQDGGYVTGASASSMSAWVKSTASGSTRYIMQYGTSTVTGQARGMFIDNTGVLTFTGQADDFAFSNLPALYDGDWHYVSVVVNGATSVTGYVDMQSQTGTLPSSLSTVLSGIANTGAKTSGTTLRFSGVIDEPHFYNRALSAAEQINLATAGPYSRVNPSGFSSNLTAPVTFVVKDFFSNELYNATRIVTSDPYFWDVPIPYRLFKVLNERDDLTAVSIKPGSATPIAMDLMPHEIWSVPLKSGISYTITFTLKDRDFNAIGTLTLTRTLSSATSYIVNGTNIQEVLTNLDGLTLTVNQFNDLLQPGVLLRGDLPFVPDRADPVMFESIADPANLDPYRTTMYEVHRNGTGSSFQVGSFFSAAEPTVSMLRDDLFLAGTYTRLYVNDTKNTTSSSDDSVLVNTTSALGYKALQGQNVTVRTLGGSVTADRFSKVRLVNAFSWSQDLETKVYSYQPSLSNPLNVSQANVYMFASWVPNHTPDPNTVVVMDVQNSIVLTRGVNYDLTDGGVYLMLNALAAGLTRSFLITYEQSLNDTTVLEPTCYPGQLGTGTYGGQEYSRIDIVCTSLNPNDYAGRLVMVLKTAQPIDRTSVIVVDDQGREVAGGLLYWNDGRTLVVQRQAVSAHASETYSVYFTFEPELGTVNWFRTNAPYVALALAIAAGVAAAGFVLPAKADPRSQRRQEISKPAFIGFLSLFLIVVAVAFLV